MASDAPAVEFAGDRMSVRFDRFGPAAYARFLQVKRLPESSIEFDPADESYTVTAPARFAALLGAVRPAAARPVRIASHLFPDQRQLTRQALDAKRFALWCACGFGKTPMGLEYARIVQSLTRGRVLVVTIAEVVREWQEMAERFYKGKLNLYRVRSKSDLREWCTSGEPGIAIANFEKFNPDKGNHPGSEVVNECRHLAGFVLDEADRLRASGGRQKWALLKSCKGIEYKLALTATPAPNDLMEFASQASWLEKMRTETDIIWTYFTRDPRTQKWTVKPHARAAFFEWMSTWSVYVNDPRRFGWRLDMPEVPDPDYRIVDVPATPEQLAVASDITADPRTGQRWMPGCAPVGIVQRGDLSQVAKGFRYTAAGTRFIPSEKPGVVADIVRREAASGAQVLVWTEYDAEADILLDAMRDVGGVARLTGAVKPKDRPGVLDAFRRGDVRVLIGRAKMLGYGMNFQFVSAMVFSGFTDSFARLYQAVRRAVRFGQTERVRVYFPVVRELEGDVWDNLDRKQREFLSAVTEMEDAYIRARSGMKGVTG